MFGVLDINALTPGPLRQAQCIASPEIGRGVLAIKNKELKHLVLYNKPSPYRERVRRARVRALDLQKQKDLVLMEFLPAKKKLLT